MYHASLRPEPWAVSGKSKQDQEVTRVSQSVGNRPIPELDDDQLGLLRHVVSIAHQLPGDWANMGALEPGQEGDDGYRYQLSMMTCMLAAAQYHKTPAYRELYKAAIETMIEKMMRFDVWGYWELTSKGGIICDPDIVELGEGWIDPVKSKNLMYGGHLLHMINLHEVLYREGKYAPDGALTFAFDPLYRGMGPQTFKYNEGELLRIILDQFKDNGYLGCECEPNLIFPFCNQFPILSAMLHDHVHGTDLAPDIMDKFKKAWSAESALFTNADTPVEQLPLMHMVRQKVPVPNGSLGAGLAVLLHPWNREYAEALYKTVRDHVLRVDQDGRMSVDQIIDIQEFIDQGYRPEMMGVSTFGFVLLAASEMGDEATEKGLLDFVERNLNPTRENGCLSYQRGDDIKSKHYATRLTTNAMIPWARMNPKDGLWTFYNQPWGETELAEPQIGEVDYPKALVTRAYHDRTARQLHVTLRPGRGTATETAFAAYHLTPGTDVPRVTANERPVDGTNGSAKWEENVLRITLPFREKQDVIIAA